MTGGEVGDVRLVTGRYFQDWLLLERLNWRLQPSAAGRSGRRRHRLHWLDLTSFITGHRIVAVMAELATFIGARREPTGPVETFSTETATETITRQIATEDAATILLRFDNGARGSLSVSQISAGRKNSLQYEIDGSTAAVAWDSEQPDQLWIGHRDRPNEILIKNPALMGPAGRAAAALPGGHVEGFADTFGAHFRAVYGHRSGRPSAWPATPRSRTGTTRCWSMTPSPRVPASGRWVDVVRAPADLARRAWRPEADEAGR